MMAIMFMEQSLESPDMVVPGLICAGAILIMGILFIWTIIKARIFE